MDSVVKHRIAAATFLVAGTAALAGYVGWMGLDSPRMRADRERLQGHWVATLVQATENNRREGDRAKDCRVAFEGHRVSFENMIEGFGGRGTYYLDPSASPARIDLKLDSGWVVGVYSVDRDGLTLCVNAMTMPERFGVPSRARPANLGISPGRYVYRFAKAGPGGPEVARR